MTNANDDYDEDSDGDGGVVMVPTDTSGEHSKHCDQDGEATLIMKRTMTAKKERRIRRTRRGRL